jgi:hypothetical protein
MTLSLLIATKPLLSALPVAIFSLWSKTYYGGCSDIAEHFFKAPNAYDLLLPHLKIRGGLIHKRWRSTP